jgi:hypothetical protein
MVSINCTDRVHGGVTDVKPVLSRRILPLALTVAMMAAIVAWTAAGALF